MPLIQILWKMQILVLGFDAACQLIQICICIM